MKIKLHESKQSLKRNFSPFRRTNFKDEYLLPQTTIKENFGFEHKMKIVIEGQANPGNINELCFREGISLSTFHKWSLELLSNTAVKTNLSLEKNVTRNQDERFRLVIEGKSGVTSVGEICNRENISHNLFLEWSQEFVTFRRRFLTKVDFNGSCYLKNKLLSEKFSGKETTDYLENFIDFSIDDQFIVSNANSILNLNSTQKKTIICFQKINDIRFINKYFEKVNSCLPSNGLFVGCVETFAERKNRKVISKFPVLRDVYFMFEFFFKRILPKLSLTKKYYFDFTKGNDRLLSKAEGLGRLVSSGFKIMDHKSIDGLLYFVVKKVKEPSFDMNPSYGPIYAMPRLGKEGKIINVYKFRTMHPYSEYLQDYVLRTNGYADSGKPAEDFRIPKWGKIMRRVWLDEIPQIINVVKGEMKLVGIRPVSKRYFEDIPKEMRNLRMTQKPGCIPPYVALNRDGSVLSVLQAEREYLEEKINKPYNTDVRYFFNALINIIFRNKRSA